MWTENYFGNWLAEERERISFPKAYPFGILQSQTAPYLFLPDGWNNSLLTNTPSPFPPNALARSNIWGSLNQRGGE